jgi:hypothetical protein
VLRRRAFAAAVVAVGIGVGLAAVDPPGDDAATGAIVPVSTTGTSVAGTTEVPSTVASVPAPSTATTNAPPSAAPPSATRQPSRSTTTSPQRRERASTAASRQVAPPVPTGAPIVTHRAGIDVLAPTVRAVPVRVQLPSVVADGPVIPVGVDAAGELFIPPDAGTLVWYGHGPSPGEPGSAVVAGHLDWKGELGVFNRLADTAVGDVVTVTYSDGTVREFSVTTVQLVPKPAIGVHGVFVRDGPPTLRLVTCGGEFDDATRHYLSNVVVTAVPS